MLSSRYDEFLMEEDYWFLVFTVGGTLGCGGFRREGEIRPLWRLRVNEIKTSSWRQLELDTIPGAVKNINLKGWRIGLEV